MSDSIIFAGHSAVLCNISGKTIAIDPWLEGNPSCPEELKNPEALDAIVLTHGHADHASDASRLAKQYSAPIFAVYELANILATEGVQNTNGMNPGGTATFENISISLTPAFHSSSYDTVNGPVYAGVATGVVLQSKECTIHHGGDTALFTDLKLIGERYQPDVSFLPIGDLFTMNPEDAATAAKWLQAKTAIPIHYGTFPALTGTAEQFQTACNTNQVNCKILSPGESLSL